MTVRVRSLVPKERVNSMDVKTITQLISDVSTLLDTHGKKAVMDTIRYLERVEYAPFVTLRAIDNIDGYSPIKCQITRDEYDQVKAEMKAQPYANKITAIKLLRSFTSIGLREAKYIVEQTNWD